MPGERREVHIQVVEVHGHVWHRLAGIQHEECADLASPPHCLLDVQHRTGDVRLVRQCHDLRLLAELQAVQVDAAVLSGAEPLQGCARATCQLLPGHEVGVVLQLGYDDLVAFGDLKFAGPGIPQDESHLVERLGGVLREGDLLIRRANEGRDGLAGALISVGGLLRDLVGTAVDRGVVLGEEVALRVQHLQGALRGRPGIEVDQRLAVPNGAGKDGEILSDRLGVEMSINHENLRFFACLSAVTRLKHSCGD